jgi:DNA-binding NtrC family response regulator
MRILILDDYLQAAQLFSELIRLSFPEIEIHVATTYFDAVGQNNLTIYDMIISDIDLRDPEHNGWDFISQVQKMNPGIHVVVYSAQDVQPNEQLVDLRMVKPIDTNKLLNFIESVYMANYPEWKDMKASLEEHHKTCQENNNLLYSRRQSPFLQWSIIIATVSAIVLAANRQILLEEKVRALTVQSETSINTLVSQNEKIINLLHNIVDNPHL